MTYRKNPADASVSGASVSNVIHNEFLDDSSFQDVASYSAGKFEAKPRIEDGVGLGLDIVSIDRISSIIKRSPRFASKVFTEGERAYCDKTGNPSVHYATRFAAKQAVLKTLGLNCLSGVSMKDVEIVRTSKGRPIAKLKGKVRKEADSQGVLDMPVSLSFTHSEAVGCAMAITIDSVSASKKRVDPMRELSLQFKQARQMLDKLPATDSGQNSKKTPAISRQMVESIMQGKLDLPLDDSSKGDEAAKADDGSSRGQTLPGIDG